MKTKPQVKAKHPGNCDRCGKRYEAGTQVQLLKAKDKRRGWATRHVVCPGQGLRRGGVLIRFECPLCGDTHSRDQHGEVSSTDPAHRRSASPPPRRTQAEGRRWLFWDQPHKREVKEVRRAQAAGLELEYMKGQRWKAMVDAETERRRAGRAA